MRETINTVMEVPDCMYMYSVNINNSGPILIFVNKKNVYDAIESASNSIKEGGLNSDKIVCNYCGEYKLTIDDEGVIGYANVVNTEVSE